MKDEKQVKKQSPAHNAGIHDKSSEPQWPRLLTGQTLTFAIMAVGALALASGCATREHAQACYSPPPATAYAEPAPQPAPQPVPTVQPNAQASMVVPLH